MAVILQEVVGNQYGDRYYPSMSGVARSLNYYPLGDEMCIRDRNRSGRCVMQAPTNRPPLEPPTMAILSLFVYFWSIESASVN